jgi:putative spermidine/putrescine transport system ATP-binding protein
VFDRPASAFVARFIGGHNVLPEADGTLIAVRADRCRLAQDGHVPAHAASAAGLVSAIEDQGPLVRVALATHGGAEAVALLPDDQFFSNPVTVGEPATLMWSPADVHHLPA